MNLIARISRILGLSHSSKVVRWSLLAIFLCVPLSIATGIYYWREYYLKPPDVWSLHSTAPQEFADVLVLKGNLALIRNGDVFDLGRVDLSPPENGLYGFTRLSWLLSHVSMIAEDRSGNTIYIKGLAPTPNVDPFSEAGQAERVTIWYKISKASGSMELLDAKPEEAGITEQKTDVFFSTGKTKISR